MKNRWILALLLFAGTCFANAQSKAPASDPPQVLLVVSGEGRDGGKTRPGFEMEELAQTWAVLKDNGILMHIASPQGGPVVADEFNPKDPYNARFLADTSAMSALQASKRISRLKAADYAAVVVIGGKGAMFDLPKDATLISMLEQVHARGGVIAGVCHGPAVFAMMRDAQGQPFLRGRRVNGFTDEEEAVFGKTWRAQFPFQIESRFRELGAVWEEAPLMLPKVVVHDRVISGQNPFSTLAFAEALVRALGREPVARTVGKDERTMQLAEAIWREGDAAMTDAAQALRDQPEAHHAALLGMLGHYQAIAAGDSTSRRNALRLMRLAAPHMNENMLLLSIARAHAQEGEWGQARSWLVKALQADAKDADALALQREWEAQPTVDR